MNQTLSMRSRVLALHLSFERMLPFVTEAQRLSINAQVVAARLGGQGRSYAAVVLELGVIANLLENLISQVADSFRHFVDSVANMGQQELRMASYLQTLQGLKSNQDGDAKRQELRDRAAVQFEAVALVEQRALLDSLKDLMNRIRGIEEIVDEVRVVASRRSHFVAFVAKLEASRIEGERQEIESVSEGIGNLAERLAVASEMLRRDVRDLRDILKRDDLRETKQAMGVKR